MKIKLSSFLKALFRPPQLFLVVYLFAILIFSYLYSAFPESIKSSDGVALKEGFEQVYFSIVTITTLGYGDFSPVNTLGQILVSLEVLIGIIVIGLLLISIGHKLGITYTISQEKTNQNEKQKLLIFTYVSISRDIFTIIKHVIEPTIINSKKNERYIFEYSWSQYVVIHPIVFSREKLCQFITRKYCKEDSVKEISQLLKGIAVSIDKKVIHKSLLFTNIQLETKLYDAIYVCEKNSDLLNNYYHEGNKLEVEKIVTLIYEPFVLLINLLQLILKESGSGYLEQDWENYRSFGYMEYSAKEMELLKQRQKNASEIIEILSE